MSPLDRSFEKARLKYVKACLRFGPRSKEAKAIWRDMHNLNNRILRRDARKAAA